MAIQKENENLSKISVVRLEICVYGFVIPERFYRVSSEPRPPGFPLKTCGNDISSAIKQDMQISNRTTLSKNNFGLF
ncbi:hypothetical protein B188_16880 [Candidatus Brocadiaceae bacterium B188]|nr:hypothetical protein B188_16880 [Candidatus Brocadiaceae bacterium B188]